MFKTITRFTSSFAAILMEQTNSADAESQLEKIRTAMLDELLDVDESHAVVYGRVWSAIDSARDIQSLWYLRSDVLKLISGIYGEELAWKKLEKISEMFRGFVPKNQLSGNAMRKK